MATAADYAITFPYGAHDPTYYIPPRFHRGNDRPTPTGTPVVIAGVTIGYTGATGLVSGPHLHTQSGTDIACQNTFNGNGVTEFKPGKVVATGYGSQWGNYVTVQVGDKYVTYCHLSSINSSVGQVISGAAAPVGGNTVETIKSMYWRLLGREADAGGIQHHAANVGSKGWEFVYNDLKNSAEGQRDWDRRNPTRVSQLEAANNQKDQIINELRAALANEQAKPPKEVVKEVIKIVEKPVEVVKEVYTHDKETADNVSAIRNMVQSLFDYFNGQYKTFKKYIKK